MIQIQNEHLSVIISEKGAELMSVQDKFQDYEWLWQGNPEHWGKRAPILFPFIGCVKAGQYQYKNETYAMSKHGFARDMVFELEEQAQDYACFVLKSSEKTLAIYPFNFELRVHYKLLGKTLSVDHEVRNLEDAPLHFSLGAHPAFNCPMDSESWSIEFEASETLESTCIDLTNGLILDELRLMGTGVKQLPLSRALFMEDALVFESLKSKQVVLQGPQKWQRLLFSFTEFPIMAFWTPSATKAPFICLEPWFGIADKVDHSGKLEEKYANVILEAKAKFSAVVEITVAGNVE